MTLIALILTAALGQFAPPERIPNRNLLALDLDEWLADEEPEAPDRQQEEPPERPDRIGPLPPLALRLLVVVPRFGGDTLPRRQDPRSRIRQRAGLARLRERPRARVGDRAAPAAGTRSPREPVADRGRALPRNGARPQYVPSVPTPFQEGGRMYMSVRALAFDVEAAWQVTENVRLTVGGGFQNRAGELRSGEDGNRIRQSSPQLTVGLEIRW